MMLTMLAGFWRNGAQHLISERTTMALQHLKDTGKRFTYDKYGWDVDEDNNFVENEEEQYWIEYMKVQKKTKSHVSQIARELNACEVPIKKKSDWSHKQGLKNPLSRKN